MKSSIIQQDLYRYEGERCYKLFVFLKYKFFVPGFTYIYYFRKCQLTRNSILKSTYKIILRFTSYITHIQIPPETKICPGFRIVHFGTIVINPNTVIGKNFNISQGTLIGNAQGKRCGTPVIGDNVCMNANSVIIGNCHIGNNVLIAPGAFINFDVPDNSIVIGNPGKIIQRDTSPTEKYIVYPLPN